MIFSMLPELEKKKKDKNEADDKNKGKKPILVGKAAEEQKLKE